MDTQITAHCQGSQEQLQTGARLNFTTLHCTAMHCTVLGCTALHFTALHCTALTALNCTALHSTALPWTSLYCIEVMLSTALYCITRHCTAMQWNTLYCTGLYCTAMYYRVLYFYKEYIVQLLSAQPFGVTIYLLKLYTQYALHYIELKHHFNITGRKTKGGKRQKTMALGLPIFHFFINFPLKFSFSNSL